MKGKFDFSSIGTGPKSLPDPKPTKKTPAKASPEARTKTIKFYVTESEYAAFIEMLDKRSASTFMHDRFKEMAQDWSQFDRRPSKPNRTT